MKYPFFTFITLFIYASVTLCMNQSTLNLVSGNCARKKLKTMSLEEKIGQLFMVATVSDPHFTCLLQPSYANKATEGRQASTDAILQQVQDERVVDKQDLSSEALAKEDERNNNDTFLKHCPYKTDHAYIKKLIKDYHVGGIIFLGYGNPETQKKVTEQFQQLSKNIPLLVGQDCEWGLSMRLENTTRFPHNMALGAIQDNDLIYQLGKEIGRQCALLGMHINFAPVVDINTNPDNPIINDRSFGEDKKQVTIKALAYMRGLHAAGVLACAKHFPGHGDTATDSHLDLPIIKHDKKRLDEIELYPFKQLIDNGIALIMIAHLAVPTLEKEGNRPATLSKNIITDLLKKELGFNGLVVTDGLGMSGITKNCTPGNLELQALLAGNDILLCPMDVPKAVALIKQAIKQKNITKQELDKRVLKILLAKEWVLKQRKKIIEHDAPLPQRLNTPYARALKGLLYEKAITVVRDKSKMIPLNTQQLIHVLLIGTQKKTWFAKTLENNIHVKIYYVDDKYTDNEMNILLKKLESTQHIIIGLHGMTRFAKENYGITPKIIKLINTLCTYKSVALAVFGNPYSLKHFKTAPTLICAYEDDKDAQISAANVFLGNIKAKGKLPVKID